MGPGDRVTIAAPHLGYHGWSGVVVRSDRGDRGLVPVMFPTNKNDVGWFKPENLVLDAVTALGNLANE